MSSYLILIISFTFVSASVAGLLPSPTVPISGINHLQNSLTTPPPSLRPGSELRKRQDDDSAYICGYDGGGFSFYSCNDHAATCAGTILPNRKAYVYCSTSGAVIQPLVTAASSSWPDGKACPSLATCCSDDVPNVMTNLFIASGYTGTAFNCWTTQTTVTWDPDVDVLNPPNFSTSLAQLTSSSIQAPASSPSGESGSEPLDPSQSDDSAGSSGLSSGTKIGIGVGVGVGVGIVLIAAAGFFLWRRHQKKKTRRTELPAGQTPYSPQPPMSQNDTQYKYAQGQEYAQQGLQDHRLSPEYLVEAPSAPLQELSGEASIHELR